MVVKGAGQTRLIRMEFHHAAVRTDCARACEMAAWASPCAVRVASNATASFAATSTVSCAAAVASASKDAFCPSSLATCSCKTAFYQDPATMQSISQSNGKCATLHVVFGGIAQCIRSRTWRTGGTERNNISDLIPAAQRSGSEMA